MFKGTPTCACVKQCKPNNGWKKELGMEIHHIHSSSMCHYATWACHAHWSVHTLPPSPTSITVDRWNTCDSYARYTAPLVFTENYVACYVIITPLGIYVCGICVWYTYVTCVCACLHNTIGNIRIHVMYILYKYVSLVTSHMTVTWLVKCLPRQYFPSSVQFFL